MAVVSHGPIQEYVRTWVGYHQSHPSIKAVLHLLGLVHGGTGRGVNSYCCNGFVLELLHRGGGRCISLREGAGVDRCWGNWHYICLGVIH